MCRHESRDQAGGHPEGDFGMVVIETGVPDQHQGVEAHVTLTPAPGLSLDVNMAYVDATQRETIFAPGTTILAPSEASHSPVAGS